MKAHLLPTDILEVSELAETVMQSLEPLAKAQNIALKFENIEGPVNVRGDREEIAQVIQNLVQNAIRYGKNNGNAKLSITRQQDPSTGQKN